MIPFDNKLLFPYSNWAAKCMAYASENYDLSNRDM